MAIAKTNYFLAGITLDRRSKEPIYLQLYKLLQQAILDQRLRPGQQLPPSRVFAEQLNISRTTVLLAFEHLFDEGYISGRGGSGTFVSHTIPDHLLQIPKWPDTREQQQLRTQKRVSNRGKRMTHTKLSWVTIHEELQPFRPGIPALRSFPFQKWNQLFTKQSKQLPIKNFGYGDPMGYPPLRSAIAEYLRVSRGVRCEMQQVLIINGSQQALSLASMVLADEGEQAWMEDPGYLGAQAAMNGAGLEVIPVPVDQEGIVMEEGKKRCPNPKLIYLTPTHQFPLGVTMGLPRRLELLKWANQQNAWIIEDDYDSEYRYTGKPISALQGLDTFGNVIYVGTFSKVMFPGLRLGYLVVPPALVDTFAAARAVMDRSSSILEQATLSAFIEEGHFGRHIRKMRLLYQQRREVLMEHLQTFLDGKINAQVPETGLHLIGWLEGEDDDQAVSKRLAEEEIIAPPLSKYKIKQDLPAGILLGYAAYREEEIKSAIQRLAKVLNTP